MKELPMEAKDCFASYSSAWRQNENITYKEERNAGLQRSGARHLVCAVYL